MFITFNGHETVGEINHLQGKIPDFMSKDEERESITWLKKMMTIMDSMNSKGQWLCVCVYVCVCVCVCVFVGVGVCVFEQ